MKRKIQIFGIIALLTMILILAIIVEVRVQGRWDKYEQKVYVERGI